MTKTSQYFRIFSMADKVKVGHEQRRISRKILDGLLLNKCLNLVKALQLAYLKLKYFLTL